MGLGEPSLGGGGGLEDSMWRDIGEVKTWRKAYEELYGEDKKGSRANMSNIHKADRTKKALDTPKASFIFIHHSEKAVVCCTTTNH